MQPYLQSETLEIRWPSGRIQVYPGVEPNQQFTVNEGSEP